MRIDAPKTGLRFCPIFPELRPILEAALDQAPDGATYCVQRYRHDANLGTQLHRIIERAGCKPWPKTFINLRSTRRTELQEAFPSHVVDAWLGHSTKTAEQHYLQVTADHWADGATKITGRIDAPERRGNPGGNITANLEASMTNNHATVTLKKQGSALSGCMVSDDSVTPTGFEQSCETLGKTAIVGAGGNAGGNTDVETAELLTIWNALDDAGRTELLALARRLASATVASTSHA